MRRPGLYAPQVDEEPRRRASLRMLVEKKLAIVERALESNQGSVELQLARLHLCAELQEPGALAKEWQKLIFLHPNDAALWQKYLRFCQSQFSTFSVSKMQGLYGKCLSTLSAVQDGSILSHPALPGTEQALFGKGGTPTLLAWEKGGGMPFPGVKTRFELGSGESPWG